MTPKGCWSLSLATPRHAVAVLQRHRGGPFSRRMIYRGPGGEKKQDWASLGTRDKAEARALAERFLLELERERGEIAATASPHERSASDPGDGDAAARCSAGGDHAPAVEEPAAARVVMPATSASVGGPAPQSLALGPLWELYQARPGFERLDEHTKADLRSRGNILVTALGADRSVAELDTDAIEAYELVREAGGITYTIRLRSPKGHLLPARTRTTKPAGPRTVQADLKLLQSMILWAMKKKVHGRRLLAENPLEGMVIPTEKSPTRLVATHDRFVQTVAAARRLSDGLLAAGEAWMGRMFAMLAVVLVVLEGTGRRVSAILGLRWSDLCLDEEGDFRNAWITFRGDLDKAGRQRQRPLHPDVARALAAYRAAFPPASADDRCFPNREGTAAVTRDRMSDVLEEAEVAAGLAPLEGSKFHCYRRKFATERAHLTSSVVMELMGITDVKVFFDCYVHSSTEDLRHALGDARRMNDQRLERAA